MHLLGKMAICLLFTALYSVAAGSDVAEKHPPKAVETFLSEHCYDCHDDTVEKGGLNLLDLEFSPQQHGNFAAWERVFDRVETGEMPPVDEPRPALKSAQAFLTELKKPLLAADRLDKAVNGSVKVRRLTRREYEYTIHDLLGIDRPLQELLPDDPSTHGFETVATGQQLSHHNLGAYLEAADLALDDAFSRLREKSTKFSRSYTPQELARKGGGNYRGPEIRDGLSISWPMSLQFYGRLPVTTVPESGWYRVTLKDVHAINPRNPAVWGTLRSGECSSNAPILYPVGIVEATKQKRDMTFEAWIRKGHNLELKPNDVTLKRPPSGASGGNVSYKGRDLIKQGFEGIAVSSIKIESIHPNATREEVIGRLFPGITRDDWEKLQVPAERNGILKRVIEQFASRAFRRPVTEDQVSPYLELALASLEDSDKRPIDGLRTAYRAILCSPRFLTFIEPSEKLDDHALANRLSYALWCSMPDGRLRQLADEGKLSSDGKIFHAQIKRLLDDPKSQRFINSFTDQWLNLKEIDFTAPDVRMYRTFDTVVQDSMIQETRSFFGKMVDNNRSIAHLIDSNYAMLNERLARFYGMDNLPIEAGAGIQEVKVGERQRSGIVTQGSVLKVTANGTTTSPVVRGVFVGERILGLHIPPPPANVPAVEPDIRGAVSIRDQLDKHRNDESCAACHLKIDPQGFALETFDPVGLWREKYGNGKKGAAQVDPSGTTPEGENFTGIRSWKDIYVNKPDLLTEAFAKHLLTYATGAEPRFSDREAITSIVKIAREKEFGMRSIFHATLGSEVFKTK